MRPQRRVNASTACRRLDTRMQAPGTLAAGSTVRVPISGRGGVPLAGVGTSWATGRRNTEIGSQSCERGGRSTGGTHKCVNSLTAVDHAMVDQ